MGKLPLAVRCARLLGAFLLLAVPAVAPAKPTGTSVTPALVKAVQACVPAGPCAHALPVRVVIVTMFEIGKDTGDAAGEFQLWKERRGLDTRIAFPQSHHDLYYNPKTQVLGMVTGMGSIKSATATLALGLDPRFDLRRAYWLVAGIAGIDPEDASIGSVAWARYLVDGDLAHEIDPRETPPDWRHGYFPLDAKGPNDPRPADPKNGEMFEVNGALRDWAYALTKDMALPDDPGLVPERSKFTGYPNAQRPPFVLKGEQLAAMTFWHGKKMNDWANEWVHYWTRGQGEFVTSAMEETGTFQSIEYLARAGRVDRNRVMVLRGGSNFSMQPPGEDAATHLLAENEGYSGLRASLENLYLVGSRVVDELLGHWDRYAKAPPQ